MGPNSTNASSLNVRQPAVAGTFYPDSAEILRQSVDSYLAGARRPDIVPKALIAPHAGYVYSGAIAASAYVLLQPLHDKIRRVVLLGPSHRVPFHGIALSSAQAFRTPLGDISLDSAGIEALQALPEVRILDAAHALEHSLEVHLPFLQTVLDDFVLVPMAVGDASPELVAKVLESIWGGDETLIVISSDLSHYYAYDEALQLDAEVTRAILDLDPEFVDPNHACGCRPLNGLLLLANQKRLQPELLDQRNSGDTAGDHSSVVGYGAYSFT